jgi:hypothetical protein
METRMSQLKQHLSRFCLAASPVRIYSETLLLFSLLTLFIILVYQSNTNYVTVTSLVFLINPLTALYYSLRLRIPRGRWYRQLGLDIMWLLLPALLVNTVVWLTVRTLVAPLRANNDELQLFDLLFVGLLAFPYVFFRVAVRCIVWWDDLRQRRMIWSLVSNNLVTVALLQALLVLPLVLMLFSSNFAANGFSEALGTPLAQGLYRLQMACRWLELPFW